jgi:CubicO group peptidase (beta-lactamase class C family)
VKYLVLIAALLTAAALGAQTSYSPETLEKIRQVENNVTGPVLLNNEKPPTLAERMAKYKVKGMSIAVIHDYKIVWAKGYGWADEEEKRPVTPETLFEPGSISKTLNAVGILRLAQENKLDLYADINTYLKSWTFPYDSLSKGKKITLANLLSHTAGLSVHGFPGHDINGPIPTLLQVLDGQKPSFTPAVRSLFEPGLKFQYSGGGTSISEIILEDLVRQPYENWMYEQVLKPIGMTHSTYAQPLSSELRHKAATAYNSNGLPLAGKFHVYPEQAAAGLWMTPSDLCNYIIDMQLALKGQASKVLSPEMVNLHLTPYQNANAAMGTFIVDFNGAKYFQHGAGNDGFCGQFWGSIEGGYGVAVFLNTDNPKLLQEVINSVAKVYQWQNFHKEPVRRSSIPVDEKTLKTYEGLYLFDDTWAAVGKKDNEYHFYTSWTFAKMHFLTPTRFFNEEFQAEKEFLKDANGKVTGYSRTVNGQEFPRARKIFNPDTVAFSIEVINEIGWYFFETKNYKESLRYFTRGTQLHPQDLNIWVNKAHMHVLNQEPEKARDIYKTNLDKMVRPGYSFTDLMKEDFAFFKDKGLDMRAFEKIYAELGVKLP